MLSIGPTLPCSVFKTHLLILLRPLIMRIKCLWNGTTTLSITTFSITTLSIMTHSNKQNATIRTTIFIIMSVLLCWMSWCCVSLGWMSLISPLCWVSLCWVSWRQWNGPFEPTHREGHGRILHKCRLRPYLKKFPRANTLAYFAPPSMWRKNKFLKLTPGGRSHKFFCVNLLIHF
jgi:hypothetical protein